MIPESLRDEALAREWGDFLTACIVYDPPDDKLVEFAQCGGPTFVSASHKKIERSPRRAYAAPPIRVARDPDQTEIKRVVHIALLLQEIDQAHPEIRVWDLVEERGLLDQFRVDMKEIPRHLYIDVREGTTARDVENAYRVIRDIQGRQNQKGGAPPRDPLIAIQCAVLHDRHNSIDPADKRRRKWTHKKLADRFGLKSGRAAKGYIEFGRRILEEYGVQ